MFAAWEEPGVWINNAILGAVPAHSAVTRLIDGLDEHARTRAGRPNVRTGPQYISPRLQPGEDITVFPKDWFYPYLYSELHRGREAFPGAYAVHHWNNARRRNGVPR